MADRLVVIRSPEIRDEYLARYLGLINPGALRETLPASRVLRVLRYPEQHAIIWPECPNENRPLPYLAVVRMPILREATPEDAGALERYRDYAASVRAAAVSALAGEIPEAERHLIRLELAGRKKRTRAVLILTETEVRRLAGHTGGPDTGSGAAPSAEDDRPGGMPGGRGGRPE